ncbi:MAG: hypothetical protein LUF26_06000, partial [Firmicutes bacterium]|nr:hypothetical protein [Bacillota bacterium]
MIRITKYLYIHILTAVLFVICALTRCIDVLTVTYAVMLLHEAAHTAAAVCIGLKISHITLYPFGVNLKLKNKMVYSLADEIILYISGPLCNILLALLSAAVYKYHPSGTLRFFYINNAALFAVNMLPAVPLDGGVVARKILAYFLGSRAAAGIMKAVSAFVAAAVTALGIYTLYKTGFNFSLLLFSILLIGNMFTQKEKYDVDFVKELMFHSKKKTKKIKHIIADESADYKKIAKMLHPNCYN